MNQPPFEQVVARICAQDRRYAAEAFVFLHGGLMRTLQEVEKREKKARHITGAELAHGLREYALAEFGPLAMTVLARWGVTCTRDFGEIVYALLAAGLLGKTEGDQIEDFDHVYDFEEALRVPFRPPPTRRKTCAAPPS